MIPAFLLAWLLAQTAPAPVDLPESARRQIEALQTEKAARTLEEQKIASVLLFANRLRQGLPVADGVTLQAPELDTDQADRVLVDIVGEVTPALRDAIDAAGGAIVAELPEYRHVRARLTLSSLLSLARLAEVEAIQPASEAMVQRIIVNKINSSQGDVAHRAAAARALGVSGAGVRIGVISNGIDSLAARQASGDLPPGVAVLSGQAGSDDEGTAMLEIVHDLAPGSPLLFATANGGEAQLATNIAGLCNAGARVIVDDVVYPNEPVFEDGIVAQAVNTAIANGCHYFSSAGNSGNLNDGTSGVWEGDFNASGNVHNFGGAISNLITHDPPDSKVFTLQWSDKWGASSNDYDLYLFSADLTTMLAASENFQNGSGDPFEFILSNGINHANRRLVIVRYAGSPRFLHLNAHRGRLQLQTAGQTFGHATAELAYGVAAVDVATAGGGAFVGGATNPVENFSSDGPRRMFYSANGAAITPGNFSSTGGAVRQKPDIAAADRVATSTPGFNLFPGTSAAAPHAAAIAALVLQAAGGANSLSIHGLRNVLLGATLDIETSGVDRDSGYGILDAYRAVTAVRPSCTYSVSPTSISLTAAADAGSVTVTAGVGCGWTAMCNATWLVVTGGNTGSGSGTSPYSVTANTGAARAGTLTVAGVPVTVSQAAGMPCTYSVSPTSISFTQPANAGTVSVTAGVGCGWTAVSNATWLAITSGNTGSGAGTSTYSVAANTGAARVGTLTVAGVTVTVSQSAMLLTFTDNLLTTSHSIRVVHLTELRQRIDGLRAARGLIAFSWTDPTVIAGVTPLRSLHLTELRTALAAVYAAAARSAPTYTDAAIVPGVTVVKASHIAELRAAVIALE